MHLLRLPALALLLLGSAGCAHLGLGGVVRVPEFRHVEERPSEVRLIAPTFDQPLGGVALRLWARVHNPNAFGVVLSSLAGTLALEQQRAAQVSFPLGLPLRAVTDTIIPLDVSIGFADIPGLRDPLLRAIDGVPIGYSLHGTVQLDAGALGQPTFGPMTLLQGAVATRR